MNFKQTGYTIIKLMLTIAVLGVLASIAASYYTKHTDRAAFEKTMQTGNAMTTAVGACGKKLGTFIGCNNGVHDIPAATGTMEEASSVIVEDGVITATGAVNDAIYTYTLTPELTDGAVTWVLGGTCVASKLCIR